MTVPDPFMLLNLPQHEDTHAVVVLYITATGEKPKQGAEYIE